MEQARRAGEAITFLWAEVKEKSWKLAKGWYSEHHLIGVVEQYVILVVSALNLEILFNS